MKFDTKIAVVVRDDLETWQELNVTAFTISGIAGTQDVMGEAYEDGSGQTYLPMIKQPIMVFCADGSTLQAIHEKALRKDIRFTVYTEELFATPNDEENRAAVKAVPTEALNLVGMALYGKKKAIDTVMKGVPLHR
ncbi:DUF2000 domain-containing protein [Oceanidesulfovibrio marinus]|uniref:DUF2000 domain-containing protein n=1 Tax=Oceanidesulfovibrio marinus TaxID=370038 RepID=A0ABX6NJ41_9BACT|nr:DUF2000 domain-containing protein [Oceanidesulfovibrio marinus]QJT10627.1 DUF2000 domain-containing protein [Oceanidesulfovibrio marinus]